MFRKRKRLFTSALCGFVCRYGVGDISLAAAADSLAAIVLHRLAVQDHRTRRGILAGFGNPCEGFLQRCARDITARQHDGVVIAPARRTFERLSHTLSLSRFAFDSTKYRRTGY